MSYFFQKEVVRTSHLHHAPFLVGSANEERCSSPLDCRSSGGQVDMRNELAPKAFLPFLHTLNLESDRAENLSACGNQERHSPTRPLVISCVISGGRVGRNFRSVLETVHAVLPCRTMRYFRADCHMTRLMTEYGAQVPPGCYSLSVQFNRNRTVVLIERSDSVCVLGG